MKKHAVFRIRAISLGILLINGAAVLAADAHFESSHYTGSGRCAQCHDGLRDSAGHDLSIVKHWSTSMMANSSRDPYWRAKVGAELERNPTMAAEINDKCSRCHAPMANDSAKKDGQAIEILGPGGFLSTESSYHDAAIDGVSCSLCHQISDDGNLGTLAGNSGNFTVAAHSNPLDRPAFGQYTDPFTAPMQNNVRFTPQYGAHMVKSEICGTCHDLKTPFVDAAGKPASTTAESGFPEQMIYSEWKHSRYAQAGDGQNCQDCHMPMVDEAVRIASQPRMILPRQGFRQHSFLGANTTMLGILDDNRVALGVSATGFDQAIIDTRALLKTAASLEIKNANLKDGQLDFDLTVSNQTGHKLPGGYPSRRVFIHVVVTDADSGEVLFESGRLSADGSIEGADNDRDSSQYEPHYDLITQPEQVQIYEPIMQDTDGKVTHTLLRAAAYIKDNRLTPSGFDKANVPNDVAVKGAAVEDDDFNLGSDTVSYQISVDDTTKVSVRTELIYQSLSYGHLQDLFEDSEKVAEIAAFEAMFDSARIRGETIASLSMTLDENNAPVSSNSPGGSITTVTQNGSSAADNAPTTGAGAGTWLWLLPLLGLGPRGQYQRYKRTER
ncbi:MAG: multiheme c-type cytochrome [Thiotrichales bacterium]